MSIFSPFFWVGIDLYQKSLSKPPLYAKYQLIDTQFSP
jgi:hypothetical protein